MFKAPFSFNGRIRRTEFGISYIIYFASFLTISFLSDAVGEFFVLLIIPIIWFLFAQGAKRCHDRGNSGWFQLIPFYNLWMLFADSDIGENEYGLNPKGIGNTRELDELANHLVK